MSDRILRSREENKSSLIAYLDLEPIPDELLKPDLRHASPLCSVEADIEMLSRFGDPNTAENREYLLRGSECGNYAKGITDEERSMVDRRYRYARDVKIIALAAELLAQETLNVRDDTLVLPSGIKIEFFTDQPNVVTELLDPHFWRIRTQLKDRVYQADTAENRYILKEQKTDRHMHVFKHGHRPGNTSSDEAKASALFSANACVELGDISLSWEKPIASVTYPDGFQFAIFTFDERLASDFNVTEQLTRAIRNNRGQFEEEYQRVKEHSKRFMSWDAAKPRGLQKPPSLPERLIGRLHREPTLSFDEFARVKAFTLQEQARDLLDDTVLANGHNNSDADGYAFNVLTAPRVTLEIIGFDFEYVRKSSDPDWCQRERRDRRERIKKNRLERGIYTSQWKPGQQIKQVERAAYLAMIDLGYPLQAA